MVERVRIFVIVLAIVDRIVLVERGITQLQAEVVWTAFVARRQFGLMGAA